MNRIASGTWNFTICKTIQKQVRKSELCQTCNSQEPRVILSFVDQNSKAMRQTEKRERERERERERGGDENNRQRRGLVNDCFREGNEKETE